MVHTYLCPQLFYHSISQGTFKTTSLSRKGEILLEFRSLISARDRPSVSACVCVWQEAEREEFVSDFVIRSSQRTHIGVLSGWKHTHRTKHTHQSRDLLQGESMFCLFLTVTDVSRWLLWKVGARIAWSVASGDSVMNKNLQIYRVVTWSSPRWV